MPQIRSRFVAEDWQRMHHLHALPPDRHQLPYEAFLTERRKLMAVIIRSGFESLQQESAVA